MCCRVQMGVGIYDDATSAITSTIPVTTMDSATMDDATTVQAQYWLRNVSLTSLTPSSGPPGRVGAISAIPTHADISNAR